MGFLLIDPPVGPFHSAEEIRAWVRQLEQRKREEQNPQYVAQFAAEIERAQDWLQARRLRGV